MMRKRGTPAVALLLALAAACAPADDAETVDMPAPEAAEPAAPAPPAELEAAGDAFVAAWNQEDAAVLGNMFTENATVVSDDTATFNGRQQIVAEWIEPALGMISNLEVQDEVWTAEGQGFRAAGRFMHNVTMPEGETHVTGRYETTWMQDADGQWRVSSMRTNADPATTTSM